MRPTKYSSFLCRIDSAVWSVIRTPDLNTAAQCTWTQLDYDTLTVLYPRLALEGPNESVIQASNNGRRAVWCIVPTQSEDGSTTTVLLPFADVWYAVHCAKQLWTFGLSAMEVEDPDRLPCPRPIALARRALHIIGLLFATSERTN